ncbi:MAG: GatB/YqeY domain-containing protein [Lactobacillales bacterium]|jgi:uncharacterized protein YqeY|nr:GatB/YqeY domain-containing protein [Lactobacillales bacterium]
MSLLSTLNEDLKIAMRAKDKNTLTTVRMLKAALQNEQIKVGHELNDEEELTVLARENKQRRDALKEFQGANRDDLVQKTNTELAIVEKYLPKQLSEEEIETLVKEVMASTNATSKADFGKIMSQLMPKLKGKADGIIVKAIVKKVLK